MAVNVRHPIWLPAAPKPGIAVISILYMIETFVRATVVTVIPVQAYDIFQDEQLVSFAYSATGVAALSFSFALPWVIGLLTRRWAYTAGCLLLIASGLALISHSVEGQLVGMIARIMGTACLNVTLNLYVLDHIRRAEFVRNDSTRLTFAAVGWTLGPYLGVWLYVNHGVAAPYLVSIGFAAVLMVAFWYVRLTEKIGPGRLRTTLANPFRFIPRFFSQPRLRLAWFIAFSRSTYWVTLFIYGPLLMVIGGYGKEYGGLLVSAANAVLILTLLWGRLAERITVRRVLVIGMSIPAAFMFVAGYTSSDWPLVTAGLLILSTTAAVSLDAAGGTVFFRAVHPHERTAMTSVYRTYLDFSDLLPPLLYGILLGFFGLGAVFVALGVLLSVTAWLCWRYLPRRI